MYLRLKLLNGLLTFVFLIAGVSTADIIPIPGTQPLRPIFERSNLVCNCTVESLRTIREQKIELHGKPLITRDILARVRINDLYKSTIPSIARTIEVEFDSDSPIMTSKPTLSANETALIFLNKQNNGRFTFADQFLGAIPFTDLPTISAKEGLPKLETALSLALQNTSRADQMNALLLLEGLDSWNAATLTNLSKLCSSTDPEIALSAIAVLLKANGGLGLSRLSDFLSSYKGDAHPIALISIGIELGKLDDKGNVAVVEDLSSSRYLSIRMGAMDALRRVCDMQCGRTFIKRLDDPNADVQYSAVKGLAEIFHKDGDYDPPLYMFDRTPETYRSLWKRWWTQEGIARAKG